MKAKRWLSAQPPTIDPPCDHWLPMVGMIPPVPRNATWLVLMQSTGVPVRAHWAQGGGEEQPPFRGWFRACGSMFVPIDGDVPLAWRPETGACCRCGAALQPLEGGDAADR